MNPLVTTARASFNATLSGLATSSPDYLAALISAASDAIQRACLRQFGPGSYTEYHDGNGYPNQYLQLDQSPVTAITRLATRPVPALQLLNSSPANQRATVATTATGLTLTTAASGALSITPLLYANYPTLMALATAIAALGNGWSAVVDPMFPLYPSADIRPLQGAITAMNRSAGLEVYAETDHGPGYNDSYANLPFSGWRLDAESAQLWGHFPEGRSNIRIDYTAGDAEVPDDIQQACVRFVTLMAEDERRDSRVDREQIGPYQVYFTDRLKSLIRDASVWDLISPHRDLSQLV